MSEAKLRGRRLIFLLGAKLRVFSLVSLRIIKKNIKFSSRKVLIFRPASKLFFAILIYNFRHFKKSFQWKGSYGLPQSTASLHQRFNQTFLYFGAMFLSAFYSRLTPRQWLTISTVFSLFGYLLIYFANWWPVEYFIYPQIAMGVLSGIGAGFSFGIICITPQNWLDEVFKKKAERIFTHFQTRNKWNPYLFIGAPIFISALVPFTSYLSTVLSWTGALLIMIGIFFHQGTTPLLFTVHFSFKIRDRREITAPTLNQPQHFSKLLSLRFSTSTRPKLKARSNALLKRKKRAFPSA